MGMQELEGHAGFVTSCVLSADSNRAVTTSGDCTGMVWRVADGKCVEVLQGHSAPLIAACLTRKSRCAPLLPFALNLSTLHPNFNW